MDFAKRAFDHSYHIDPIVRSLLDTDFYKLLMLQFIWKKYYNTSAGKGTPQDYIDKCQRAGVDALFTQ